MMSTSGAKPPGWLRWSSVYPSGTSSVGSTGSCAAEGMITASWSTVPSSSMRYHSGRGTPKKRWRETSQSMLRPFTQMS